jgi:hypothetical protein
VRATIRAHHVQALAFGEPKCSNDGFDDVIALAYVSHVDILESPIPKDELEGGCADSNSLALFVLPTLCWLLLFHAVASLATEDKY